MNFQLLRTERAQRAECVSFAN